VAQCHRQTLENAKSLEDNKYNTYAIAPDISQNEPWKLKVKALAAILVERAHRCRHRNESTWRHACEPIILDRLSSEVCWLVFCYTREVEVVADASPVATVGSESGGLRSKRLGEMTLQLLRI